MIVEPWRVCVWLGHNREMYCADTYTDGRGRWRERWYSRCKRCGTSDGGTVFEPGILEFTWFRMWRARTERRIKEWCREDCDDCRKPKVRFGRPVGNHLKCEEIPF